MAAAAHNDDELITGINVTPLVDITLVLLVILMVTASYVVSRAIPMELPKGATAEATPDHPVGVDRQGRRAPSWTPSRSPNRRCGRACAAATPRIPRPGR